MEHPTTSQPKKASFFRTVKTRQKANSSQPQPSKSAVSAELSGAQRKRAKEIGDVLSADALKKIAKDTDRGMTSITDDFDSHILEGAKIVKKYWESFQDDQATLTRKTGVFSKRSEQVTPELMIEKFQVLQRNSQLWLDTREKKGDGDSKRQAKTKACQDFIELARLGIEEVRVQIEKARLIEAKLGATAKPTAQTKATALIEVCGCKPPAEKGQSDSFTIYGIDGKPAYFYKPVQGEAYPGYGWPEGGGAPREALCGKVGELLQNLRTSGGKPCPLDIRFPKAEVANLTDDSFRQGSISQSAARNGVLLEAIKGSVNGSPNAEGLFGDETLSDEEKMRILKSIDKSQCKDLTLCKFITLDVDANKGNFIVQEGGESGNYGMTGFDAGRMFPSKTAVKAGGLGGMTAGTFNGAYVPPNPNAPRIDKNGSFLMMLPSAAEPFDAKQILAIKSLDADSFVQDLRQATVEMGRQAPEMDGKVEDECLELTKKSIKLLQKAVDVKPPLTLYEISLIYATGFEPIVDAADDEKATNLAIAQVLLDLKEVRGRGDELRKREIDPDTLTLQQQALILRRDLTKDDWEREHYQQLIQTWPTLSRALDTGSPELVEINATTPFSLKAYDSLKKVKTWEALGGDPLLKQKLVGVEKSYREEVKQSAESKAGYNEWYNKWVQYGGTARFKELFGDDTRFDSSIAGKKIVDLVGSFEEAMKGGNPVIKTLLVGNPKTYEEEWKVAKKSAIGTRRLYSQAEEWASLGGAVAFKKLLPKDGFKAWDGKPLIEQIAEFKRLKAEGSQ